MLVLMGMGVILIYEGGCGNVLEMGEWGLGFVDDWVGGLALGCVARHLVTRLASSSF